MFMWKVRESGSLTVISEVPARLTDTADVVGRGKIFTCKFSARKGLETVSSCEVLDKVAANVLKDNVLSCELVIKVFTDGVFATETIGDILNKLEDKVSRGDVASKPLTGEVIQEVRVCTAKQLMDEVVAKVFKGEVTSEVLMGEVVAKGEVTSEVLIGEVVAKV